LIRGRESAALILENHSGFRDDVNAGLEQLDQDGKVDLEIGDVALRREGEKYFLIRAV
jgi:hypothetical protein